MAAAILDKLLVDTLAAQVTGPVRTGFSVIGGLVVLRCWWPGRARVIGGRS
jgi:hypothetical protein